MFKNHTFVKILRTYQKGIYPEDITNKYILITSIFLLMTHHQCIEIKNIPDPSFV